MSSAISTSRAARFRLGGGLGKLALLYLWLLRSFLPGIAALASAEVQKQGAPLFLSLTAPPAPFARRRGAFLQRTQLCWNGGGLSLRTGCESLHHESIASDWARVKRPGSPRRCAVTRLAALSPL